MKSLALCLVLAVLPASLLAQPNCTRLGFDNVTPTPGTDLTRCASDEQQCCTRSYIDIVERNIREEMQEYLVEEFEDVIDDYLDDVENVIEYFDEDFIENLLEGLPGAAFINTSHGAFRALRNELIENFEIPDEDEFSVRGFVDSLLDAFSDVLEDTYESSSEDCISGVIRSQLNQGAISDMAMQLQEIRRSITTLQRVGTFLRDQLTSLQEETILEECVTRFVELAFCSRCVKATPPLCFNTCNNLLRACYSPYYTALNRQYNRLWNVVQRTLQVANSTVQRLLTGESVILDITSVVATIARECDVTLTERVKREEESDDEEAEPDEEEAGGEEADGSGERDGGGEHGSGERDGGGEDGAGETDETGDNAEEESEGEIDTTGDDTTGDSDSSSIARGGDGRSIPFGLVDDIFELSGAFQYGRRGLLFCLDGLENGGSDSCESQTDNDDRYCYREEICTARCNCWDGERMRTDDTESFDFNDVEDQDENPVLVIDQQVLESEVQRLGEPVTAFLTSDEFTSVAPDDVQDDGSSCAGVVASIGTVLLAMLMAFMT